MIRPPWLLVPILACLSATGAGNLGETMQLYAFEDPRAIDDWAAINDVVMGGVSAGTIRTSGAGTALFAGRVSLENNGGFASVRSRPKRWRLGAYAGIAIRLRGDGRRYKLNLKTDSSFDGISYRAPFETSDGEWQTLRFPFTGFEASFRGRPVPDAPPLDPERVATIGLLISDKQAGPFRLEICWIAAYPEGDSP